MAKRHGRGKNPAPRRGRGPSVQPATAPPRPEERKAETMNLIELKPGLFVNADQIVSVRILPQEDNNVYAILQLSNGDKHNLTRDEFTAITGSEPRPPVRLRLKPEDPASRRPGKKS
jgi:hypothetical protein